MADTTVCSPDSPKTTEHKSSTRKSNKPLMEKKRRARINSCLGQLKSLVLQALKKDTSQFSKLEKADILEMTVKHLKSVQQQHMSVAMATDPNVVTKYRAGFNECAGEVMRYLGSVNGLTDDTRTRVLNHLALCMQSVNTAASVSMATQAAVVANQISLGGHVGSLFPSFTTSQPQAQSAHILPTSALSVSTGCDPVHTLKVPTPRIPQPFNDAKLDLGGQSSLQLIPGTLPSGQLAFFVTSPTTPIQAIPVYATPSSGSPTPVTSPEISPRSVEIKCPMSPQRLLNITPQHERFSSHSPLRDDVVEHNNSHHQLLLESGPAPPVGRRSPVVDYSPFIYPARSPPPREPHLNPFQRESNSNKEAVDGVVDNSETDDDDEDEEEKVWRPW